MTNPTKSLQLALIALGIATLGGCGDGGKWIDSAETMAILETAAQLEAMKKKTPKADTSCEHLLQLGEKGLQDPETTYFKLAARTCSNGGMSFARAARCEQGSIQVKCK